MTTFADYRSKEVQLKLKMEYTCTHPHNTSSFCESEIPDEILARSIAEDLRDEYGLTEQQLSRFVGVSQSAFAAWTTGSETLSPRVDQKIVAGLHRLSCFRHVVLDEFNSDVEAALKSLRGAHRDEYSY